MANRWLENENNFWCNLAARHVVYQIDNNLNTSKRIWFVMYIESGGDFNVDVPVMNSWKKWKLIDLSWIIINCLCFIVNGSSWKINWVNLTIMQFLYKQENLTVINENIQISKARNNREIPFFGDRLTHEFFFFFF